MRNKQNKHGPDIDIGIWYAALLRHSDAFAGHSGEGHAGFALTETEIPGFNKQRTATPVPVSIAEQRPPGQRHTPMKNIRETGNYSTAEAAEVNMKPPGKEAKWKKHKRRRSTIAVRRPGESQPGSVDDLIWIETDSISRIKGNHKGVEMNKGSNDEKQRNRRAMPMPAGEKTHPCIRVKGRLRQKKRKEPSGGGT